MGLPLASAKRRFLAAKRSESTDDSFTSLTLSDFMCFLPRLFPSPSESPTANSVLSLFIVSAGVTVGKGFELSGSLSTLNFGRSVASCTDPVPLSEVTSNPASGSASSEASQGDWALAFLDLGLSPLSFSALSFLLARLPFSALATRSAVAFLSVLSPLEPCSNGVLSDFSKCGGERELALPLRSEDWL